MKRDTRPQFAASTAFAKSIGATDDASPQSVRLRIHRSWLAFVVGFPATTGALILWSGLSHEGADPTVVPIGLVLLAGSAALLVLGVRSYVRLEEGRLTSRFFGIRSTTVRLDQLVGATFAMLFPSISYVITIEDREGRKARVHANWWSNEQTLMNPLARALVEGDVAMDRTTARIVSKILRIKRPKARIVHRGLIWKDRTW
jgi:hypothetical protein